MSIFSSDLLFLLNIFIFISKSDIQIMSYW